MDKASKQIVACTSQGFELFDVQRDEALPKKLPTKRILLSVTKHVVFAEDDAKVVGGTDQGCAEVFHVKSGRRFQTLKYNLGGLVQSVAVSLELFFFA